MLSIVVRLCTNTHDSPATARDKKTLPCSSSQLGSAFQNAQRVSQLASSASRKQADEVLQAVDNPPIFQLNVFLAAYMYPGDTIPAHILEEVLSLCGNTEPEWASRCQTLALETLLREVNWRNQNSSPRLRPEDPTSLSSLRGVLPAMELVPKVKIKQAHFFLVGLPHADSEGVPHDFSNRKFIVKNKGWKSFRIEQSQTLSLIDNKVEDIPSVFTVNDAGGEVKSGERWEVGMCLQPILGSRFSSFQQITVFSIGGVVRIFATVTLLSLQSTALSMRFPSCLPVPVRESPLGAYCAPVVLQLLKHLFILQKGLTSPSVSHLLLGKSINFKVHNEGVAQAAARVRAELDDLPMIEYLEMFWASAKTHKKGGHIIPYTPPASLCCPSGFSPEKDFATKPVDEASPYFPNSGIALPHALKTASCDVILALIMQLLAEIPATVFDSSCIGCDPVTYISAMPPHFRGIVFYVLDLCCGLLYNRNLNGTTSRTLALTFAAILCHASTHLSSPSPQQIGGLASGFETHLAIQQSAVNALLCWINMCVLRYQNI